jgi:hypothetical protein
MAERALPDSPARGDEWTVRPYREADEAAVLRMFAASSGRSIAVGHWRWKRAGRRWPAEHAWVAERDDQPICHFAAIPTRVQVSGLEKTAAVIVDVMTAADHRRRGLLTDVARTAMGTWAAAGVSFMYGLPNEQWGSRTHALGIHPVLTLRRFVLPLRPQQTLARKLRARRLPWIDAAWSRVIDLRLVTDRAVSLHAVTEAGPEFDALWRRCAPEFGITIVRDRDRVQWRYLDAPGAGYRVLLAARQAPVGYAAYRLERAEARVNGWIAEVFAGPDDAATWSALVAGAVRAMRDAGAENVFALEVPGSPGHRALRRAGFVPARWDFVVQAASLAGDVTIGTLGRTGHWHIAGGDFDAV